MTALKIEDLKGFTSSLFVGEGFDRWLVREASIITFNTFSVDGRIRSGYFTEQETDRKSVV